MATADQASGQLGAEGLDTAVADRRRLEPGRGHQATRSGRPSSPRSYPSSWGAGPRPQPLSLSPTSAYRRESLDTVDVVGLLRVAFMTIVLDTTVCLPTTEPTAAGRTASPGKVAHRPPWHPIANRSRRQGCPAHDREWGDGRCRGCTRGCPRLSCPGDCRAGPARRGGSPTLRRPAVPLNWCRWGYGGPRPVWTLVTTASRPRRSATGCGKPGGSGPEMAA
jgi:hypothetical protein